MAFKRSGVRFPSPPYRLQRTIRLREVFAGIAQLVEHNLAKVGVAGSSPVFRSESFAGVRMPRLQVAGHRVVDPTPSATFIQDP